MSIFEYDEEGVMEVLREEARNAGLKEGRSAGLKEGHTAGLEEGRITTAIDAIKNIMKKLGKSADEAMDILDIDIDKRAEIKKQL